MALKILIAGGGIGGLTTALACAKAGHDVQVFEQAPEITATGAGIQLSPNAMKVLKHLGLEDKILAKGFAPKAIETRMGRSGRAVFNIPLDDKSLGHWGAPYIHIHRAVLIDILKAAVENIAPGATQLGQSVSGYEHAETSVNLTLSNGKDHSGDILIGADGIHSAVRTQMLGPDEARFTGNVAWRAVVHKDLIEGELPSETACAWMGLGRHAVTYHLGSNEGDNDLINFVGVVERDDWQVESWKEKGDKTDLQTDYAGWHPIITELIEAIEPDDLYRWALFDRPPLCQWTQGRVALLGDSAHPMLPFLAQGAAMAIEDAYTLSEAISKPDQKIGDALQSYQSARYQRTSLVQSASRANMKIFHRRNALTQFATYGPMWLGGKLAPSIVRGRMDWIYGG